MSVAGPIRSLLQQQDKALYQVKKKIKEQGAKQVGKVKEKLPSTQEIKDKFKPEANATTCSINGLKKSQKNYDKLKKLLNTLKKVVEGATKALKKIKEICDKIMAAIQKILGICGKLAALIYHLSDDDQVTESARHLEFISTSLATQISTKWQDIVDSP